MSMTNKRKLPLILQLLVGLAVAGVVFFLLTKVGGETVASRQEAAPAPEAAPSASDRPVIPLADAFPEKVPDGRGGNFTKVGAVTLKSCTEPDSVGPALANMIDAGKGCLGEHVALYKDGQNNQFNLAVFTMRDPQDTVTLVMRLGGNPTDYQVGAQAPPPGSGLKTLPPDSGMVQAFTGQGRSMVVGLAQWADGGTRDYQALVGRLDPLLKDVSNRVARHEQGS
ncbi:MULTISPECIES: hypothetical protein [Streptomyces]|uniref:hypothetical protein n=1 Tax=Streptomyces TaxID=1883 RepID=UPI0016791674|nr:MULTISPECIES: hypothetical protein [Streptomyces]MBD3580386.1 hypothetical protein [Streptomyces sp. KD18]